VCVQYKDLAGNLSTSYTDTIFLDQTNPTIDVSHTPDGDNGWNVNSPVTVDIEVEDLGSGLAGAPDCTDNGTPLTVSPGLDPGTYTASVGGDGEHDVDCTVSDNAGNSNDDSTLVKIDTIDPTGSITINDDDPYTNSTSATLNLDATDANGIVDYRVAEASDCSTATFVGPFSAVDPFSDDIAFTLSSGDGTKTVCVQYKDLAGNLSTSYTDTIFLDQTNPTIDVSHSPDGDNGWNVNSPVTVDIAVEDLGSGLAGDPECTDNGNPLTVSPGLDPGTYTASVSGDGEHDVECTVSDNAGNSNDDSTLVKIDTIDPTGSITINSNATYTNSTSVTLNLDATDAGSAIVSYRVATGSSCASASFVAPFSPVSPYSDDVSHTLPSGDGTKTVCVQYKDAAGNVSTTYTDSITLDQTDPTGSITINSNAAYTNSMSVTLNLNAADLNGIVSYRVANGSSCASATFVAPFSAVSPYAADVSHTLPSGDGTKTVCVQYKDAAGNVSTTYTDSIILDSTQPTASITFPGATTYNALSWNSGCGTPFVGDVCGTATDTGTGASGVTHVHIALRNSGGFYWTGVANNFAAGPIWHLATGTGTWSYAIPFSTFPTAGNYTLDARATDLAGNVQNPISSRPFSVTNVSGGVYDFTGFFSPVDNTLLNKANAGSTVPVKYRITLNGVAVSDPNSFVALTSRLVDCGTLTTLAVDDIETYSTNSGLHYTGNGNWHFNWKTPKTYAGQCRIMTLTLNDGSTHDADFKFK
jgi:hypothetical protein